VKLPRDPRDEADDEAAQLAALEGISTMMGRGRFADALDPDERAAITILIGGPPPEEDEDPTAEAEEVATGSGDGDEEILEEGDDPLAELSRLRQR